MINRLIPIFIFIYSLGISGIETLNEYLRISKLLMVLDPQFVKEFKNELWISLGINLIGCLSLSYLIYLFLNLYLYQSKESQQNQTQITDYYSPIEEENSKRRRIRKRESFSYEGDFNFQTPSDDSNQPTPNDP